MSRAREFALTEVGPKIPFEEGRPTVGLLNANPFAEGIANLGAQVIAKALLDAEINVDFGFADTATVSRPFLGGVAAPACDVIAISIPFEDTYHHVPRLLRACGLSPWAKDRSEDQPIVVAGGLALINPMPLVPFFDAMVIGEGRQVIVEMVRAIVASRGKSASRRDILIQLASIPHVYVPSLYRIEYDDVGSVTSFTVLEGAPREFPRRGRST